MLRRFARSARLLASPSAWKGRATGSIRRLLHSASAANSRRLPKSKNWRSTVLGAGGAVVGASLALVGVAGGVVQAATTKEQLPWLLKEVDRLHDNDKMSEALELLQPLGEEGEGEEVEVLWRLARLCFKIGKHHSRSREEMLELSEKGRAYAERALAADENNFNCHQWMGILLGWSSDFYGYKNKIEWSYVVKEHFERAIELNPSDPTCRHLLGQWYYALCNIPWYQVQIAAVVIATPPKGSYTEALKLFLEAEEIQPGFYTVNWLLLGKTLLALREREKAKQWLTMAAQLESVLIEDLEVKREAMQLLNGL